MYWACSKSTIKTTEQRITNIEIRHTNIETSQRIYIENQLSGFCNVVVVAI